MRETWFSHWTVVTPFSTFILFTITDYRAAIVLAWTVNHLHPSSPWLVFFIRILWVISPFILSSSTRAKFPFLIGKKVNIRAIVPRTYILANNRTQASFHFHWESSGCFRTDQQANLTHGVARCQHTLAPCTHAKLKQSLSNFIFL